MFDIQDYISPLLVNYIDKYLRNFNPADAQVTLWSGGVTLHNLELRTEVMQQEFPLPFTLVSGRIHELLISVPWTKLMSEPVVVTINTIECILSLNPPSDEVNPQAAQSGRSQLAQTEPGFTQALLRRIFGNLSVQINSLIVKYVHDDIVLSLNVKKLTVATVGANWETKLADSDQSEPVIRRLIHLDDVTLCLDKSDADGKIRFFHEPLLYRCELKLRVLTKLESSVSRRVKNVGIQLLSNQLSFGIHTDQLVLLLRLLTERTPDERIVPPPMPPRSSYAQPPPIHTTPPVSPEPIDNSWGEWIWSWFPAWDLAEIKVVPAMATPVPVSFTAHFKNVSVLLKIPQLVGKLLKQRGVLELIASETVIKMFVCSPTVFRFSIGARDFTIAARGRCVCGYSDANPKIDSPIDESWTWVDDDIQNLEVIDEEIEEEILEPNEHGEDIGAGSKKKLGSNKEKFWRNMNPVIYFEYNHDRLPSDPYVNPLVDPPTDFQFSDWVENSIMKLLIRPVIINVSTGMIHRFAEIIKAYKKLPIPRDQVNQIPTLTLEECDALNNNLPLRQINIDITGLRVNFIPFHHTNNSRPIRPPVYLYLELPIVKIKITTPLYPQRVCAAACQLPNETGLLSQAARLHASVNAKIQVGISSLETDAPRPCARADVRFVTHVLLNKQFFSRPETLLFNSTLSIKEANVSGSAARLQAIYHIAKSVIEMKITDILDRTTLPYDALNDKDYVAIDITVDEIMFRTLQTLNANTHFMTLKSIKATAYRSPDDEVFKEAWIFSAPETPSNKPYLKVALQWCNDPNNVNSVEYINISTRSTALSIDPMLFTWLSYSYSHLKRSESIIQNPNLNYVSSSQNIPRRRVTPPSSSGQGGSGYGAEQVHVRPKTLESNSEISDKKQSDVSVKGQEPEICKWWLGENLLKLYTRLDRLLVSVKVGVTQIYICSTTVSAVDCVTVRDAMERHVTASHRVLVVGLGRIQIDSNPLLQCYWEDINFEYPTCKRPLRDPCVNDNAFPWKIRISDVSCYTLQVRPGTESSGREKSVSGLRSQMKPSRVLVPQTVLESVTSNITLSVVIRDMQIATEKKNIPKSKAPDHKQEEEDKTKYFKTGSDFKPSTIKEFIRGPSRPNKLSPEPGPSKPPADPEPEPNPESTGRISSIGVNVHADTRPVIVRMDQDQVHTVAIAMHCFAHLMALLRFQTTSNEEIFELNQSAIKLPAKSASDLEQRPSVSEGTRSSILSEQLISIYEANKTSDKEIKSFFWFQWVVSRAAIVLTTSDMKLALDVDDIISSVDIQGHYNQFKLKIGSASLRNYQRIGSNHWISGVMGGRIIEAREPTSAKDDNHFLLVTVTQALVSNLPYGWKEDIHTKFDRQDIAYKVESVWEVYTTLAPLEVVIQPHVLECLTTWLHELSPHSTCSLHTDFIPISLPKRRGTWDWPYCYVNAGGLRLLITTSEETQDKDDTLMLILGKLTVDPRPANPICRQPANTNSDNNNSDNNGSGVNLFLTSRQYEILIRHVAVRSANFNQLVNHEITESQNSKNPVRENPALKWSQADVQPVITPILHGVDVGCIVAPAVYESCGTLASGPAIEVNLLSDCSLEIGIHSLELLKIIPEQVLHVFRERPRSSFDEEYICPYIIQKINPSPSGSAITSVNSSGEISISSPEISPTFNLDSGVEATTSRMNINKKPVKKSVILSTFDHLNWEFLEIFVTMGVIDISLYVKDDGSKEVIELRPPNDLIEKLKVSEPRIKVVIDDTKAKEASEVDDGEVSRAASKSLTETNRNKDAGQIKLDEIPTLPFARSAEGNLPLIHVTLRQPNLYYWNKPLQKTVQVSLYNAWIGLGMGQNADQWNIPLLRSNQGSSDPITDIPPPLATLRFDLSIDMKTPCAPTYRGIVQIDVGRPLMLEVSTDRIRRLKVIKNLIKANIIYAPEETAEPSDPFLYKLRRIMVDQQIESIIIQTSQIGLHGSKGVIGCDALRIQLAASERPDKWNCRGLVTGAVVSVGCFDQRRHVLLQPLTAGVLIDANWESWKKLLGGRAAREPSLQIGVDFDSIILNIRPFDLTNAFRILEAIQEVYDLSEILNLADMTTSMSWDMSTSTTNEPTPTSFSNGPTLDINDPNIQFYKNDLRSGAFNTIDGPQLPMAYQITLYGSIVSWRYPQPRTINRIKIFPIPELNKFKINLALELYCPILERWEAQHYFELPVEKSNVILINSSPADAVYACMWRVRLCTNSNNEKPFQFESSKFMPRQDPLLYEAPPPTEHFKKSCIITAEELARVLQVDSYFAPRFLPRAHVALRLANVQINVHNAFPFVPRTRNTTLEGCYVSRPINANHRILTMQARNSVIHCVMATSTRALIDTYIMSDLIDSATGTMERLIHEFHMLGSLVMSPESRTRLRTNDIKIILHVSQTYTLISLIDDWMIVLNRYIRSKDRDALIDKRVQIKDPAVALSGRVYLWVHNKCTDYVCVGQDSTEEVISISPGASLAYRWHTPEAPHRLQFALTNSTKELWTNGFDLITGTHRVRLDKEVIGGSGVYLYVRVKKRGDRLDLYLSGRVVLVNVTRYIFAYKLRVKDPTRQSNQDTITHDGDLQAESRGLSVLCHSDCTATFQVSLFENLHIWSGEIPLRACHKKLVPWLVKIPRQGSELYAAMWFRVIPTITDDRIVATFWPFYMLRSELPLDIEVFITSQEGPIQPEDRHTDRPVEQYTSHQSADGRGSITHLSVKGTTTDFHMLVFKYKDIDCPVTQEGVLLHYDMIDKSVFNKPIINTVEEALTKIKQWLQKASKNTHTNWPYSIVTKHWNGVWQPSVMQPKCDVNVRYESVNEVSACSLVMTLSPVALVVNSSAVSLTLRAHDGSPVCQIDSGVAVAPHSTIIKNPFFLSVEKGRDAFVSGPLEVCKEEHGPYEQSGPGQIALGKPANFAVQTNRKVALLTIHYEIIENINVLGITNSYVLINMLHTDVLVSAIAQPREMDNSLLKTVNFDIIAPPTKKRSLHGTPLCWFMMNGRWRDDDADLLRAFIYLALPGNVDNPKYPVPIHLGIGPIRRCISLKNEFGESVPIVVSQLYNQGRWLIAVAKDPCPQYVVHNRTKTNLAVAQPLFSGNTVIFPVQTEQECICMEWRCIVKSQTITHYSTPAYCAQYPIDTGERLSSLPFLTVSLCRDKGIFEWCHPIAVTDGEQLLQLPGGVTIKLFVRMYPHSSLLEFMDVDQNDISASDIRRRLDLLHETKNNSRSFESQFQQVGSTYFKNKSKANTDQARSSIYDDPNPSTSKQMDPVDYIWESNSRGYVSNKTDDSSAHKLSASMHDDVPQANKNELITDTTVTRKDSSDFSETSYLLEAVSQKDWTDSSTLWSTSERFRCLIDNVLVFVGGSSDESELIALHLQQIVAVVQSDNRMLKTKVTVGNVHVDNAQYEIDKYDFPVIATTRSESDSRETWPALWGMFNEKLPSHDASAKLQLKTLHDKWTVANRNYQELTEVELRIGPMSLYIEDEYISAVLNLYHSVVPATPSAQTPEEFALAEIHTMLHPVRLRKLYIHPVNLSITLHTAMHMYIALDESPLKLGAYGLEDAIISYENLAHAMTLHYLSAAIFGAGWVVGGLELLGAPGALAARVVKAGGGIRGVISATAGAFLRSLSSAAGSFARNLDLLAGDEEHARRAAAARRRAPPNLIAGLITGVTNFGVNILGAVGGLAHHPLLGVAVGETESGATALRRGLIGAITKPLSATADLLAFAGHGLLNQIGWDPVPRPRTTTSNVVNARMPGGWRRDCVRYSFRFRDMSIISGFEALINNNLYHLIVAQTYLVVVDPKTQNVFETVNYENCAIGEHNGEVVELLITLPQESYDDDDSELIVEIREVQAAMARVARYTGTEDKEKIGLRVLSLTCLPGTAHSILALLNTMLHSKDDMYFSLV